MAKKLTCVGYYTGENTIDGKRFNKRAGVKRAIGKAEVEVYAGVSGVHGSGNMRMAIYEYEVGGVTYQRAWEHMKKSVGAIQAMKGKKCLVEYDAKDPGKSKAKDLKE